MSGIVLLATNEFPKQHKPSCENHTELKRQAWPLHYGVGVAQCSNPVDRPFGFLCSGMIYLGTRATDGGIETEVVTLITYSLWIH